MNYNTHVQSSSKVVAYSWVILGVVYLASVVAPFNQFKVPPLMPVLAVSFLAIRSKDIPRAGIISSSVEPCR